MWYHQGMKARNGPYSYVQLLYFGIVPGAVVLAAGFPVLPKYEMCLMEDGIIWRYMDTPKFLSMLEESALYFANAVSFDDPFEGSITMKDHKGRIDRLVNEIHSATPFKGILNGSPNIINCILKCMSKVL
jgi:hypothetical protein